MAFTRFVFLTFVLTGCAQSGAPFQPPTFDRPGDVAFVCVRRGTGNLESMSVCEEQGHSETTSVVALVTQTARGEVAAVDLLTARVVDAEPSVPGYNFVRVGETPTAIVVGREHPEVTYVASFAARTIETYSTHRLLDVGTPAISRAQERASTVALNDGPVDVVFDEASKQLFVALPRIGQVAVIPIAADGRTLDAAAVRYVTLNPSVPELHLAATDGPLYEKLCSPATVTAPRPNPASSEVEMLGSVAQPVRLKVVGGEVYVADASLPVVHRISVADLSLLPSLATGAPLSDLAVTPEVPEFIDLQSEANGGFSPATTRFLYGIDATDGSVLALDLHPAPERFGTLLAVHAGVGRSDRLGLPAGARTIEVITPGFPGGSCLSDAALAPSPVRLRGVFLAVGFATGYVGFVDVHDLDAPCRGGFQACGQQDASIAEADRARLGKRNALDRFVYLRRHTMRTGSFVAATPYAVRSGVSFAFEGAPGRVDATSGDTVQGRAAPGLAAIDCAALGMVTMFGGETGRLCSVAEPWSTFPDAWRASWEGGIPGATSFRARVENDGGVIRVVAPSGDLCRRGVLGARDVQQSGLSETDPEWGYAGDGLVVTSDPSGDRLMDARCRVFVANAQGVRAAGPLPIETAANGELRLVASSLSEDLDYCYPSLFSFAVSVRGVYAVAGGRAGFLHRVVESGGACRVDLANPNRQLTARAFADRAYRNPYVAFSLRSPEGGLSSRVEAVLTFSVTDVPSGLAVDVGARGSSRVSTIVERVAFSQATERMYVVDANSDGFSEYDFLPVRRTSVVE